MTVKFDIKRLQVSDLIILTTPDLPAGDMLKVMDKATDVNLMDMELGDLPAIMSEWSRMIDEYSDVIAIALNSLRWHREDEEDNDSQV